MATVPDTIQGILDFFTVRKPVWDANKATLGLSVAQITTLGDALTAAQDNQDKAVTERAEAKSATQNRDVALAELVEFGAALIAVINGTAKATGNPDVYTTAMLPIPGTGGGATPPAMPANLVGQILNTGDVELNWGSGGRNVFYTIWRKLATETEFMQIGASQQRTFVDEDAEGAAWAAYYVIAHRGPLSSDASEVLQMVLPGWQQAAA